jgi:hypothetical protein
VIKDGQYQKENVQALIEMVAGEDEAKKAQAEPMANACKDLDDPDRCEKGVKVAKCLEKEGRERGFKS